jgi:hypothetical protein
MQSRARAYAIARTGLCNRAHGLMQSRARAYAIARTGLCNRAPTYYEQSALLPPAGV